MLTSPPTLHIRRPSPTTAEFTVSTRPPLTLPLRLAFFLVFFLRLALGTSVLLLLYTKWLQSPYSTPYRPPAVPPPFFSEDNIYYLVHLLTQSPAGLSVRRLTSSTPTWALVPPCLLALYLCILRIHTTESLLVLRGLGIQTASTGGTFLSGDRTRFIPTEKICDVLINEAFKGFGVVYYLVVVVDGEEDLVVVFPRLLPGRKVVESVWRGVRGCLYEGEEKG